MTYINDYEARISSCVKEVLRALMKTSLVFVSAKVPECITRPNAVAQTLNVRLKSQRLFELLCM